MKPKKWDERHYVTVYELARSGMTEKEVASALGVSQPTLKRWKAQKPALRDAWDRGTQSREKLQDYTFQDYVFDQLPDHLRELWQEINLIEFETNDIARIEALLQRHGKRARQHLFLYSLAHTNFNITRALRKVNIRRKTYEDWLVNEPDFAELIDEINWHKDNFFEQAFIRRVQAGDTPAVIHAAKTKLRHRGYNEKQEIHHHHDHNVNVLQATINISELDLPLDVRRTVLQAMREQRADNLLEHKETA